MSGKEKKNENEIIQITCKLSKNSILTDFKISFKDIPGLIELLQSITLTNTSKLRQVLRRTDGTTEYPLLESTINTKKEDL